MPKRPRLLVEAIFGAMCLAVALAPQAAAGPVQRHLPSRARGVHIWLDVPDRGHTRIDFPPAGREGVAGVVAVGKLPYRCDLHRQDFATEEAFSAHLRTEHKIPRLSLGDVLFREGGQIHFSGESPR